MNYESCKRTNLTLPLDEIACVYFSPVNSFNVRVIIRVANYGNSWNLDWNICGFSFPYLFAVAYGFVNIIVPHKLYNVVMSVELI